MTLSEVESIRSANSETSTALEATERLRKRHALGGEQDEEGDLLEQNKTLQEAIFSAMYMLSRSRTAESWRWATFRLILEGLVPFLVVFNPRHWPIDTSNPVWLVVRWVQPVTPVSQIWGYRTYVYIFYALVGLIFTVVIAIGVLTVAMRKQEHSKWLRRFAQLLQKFTDAMFNMAYVAVFDYIVFLFNCRFGAHGHPHQYWTDVQCLSGRHIILLSVAAVTAIVFFFTTGLMLVASCDLSPVARGIMASPAAVTRLQVLVLKALFVVAANTMVSVGKAQAVVMLAMTLGICYLNFKALPFLRLYINDVWVGIWVAVSYLCMVHMIMDIQGDRQAKMMTRLVLYGTFPALFLGAGLTALWSRWRLRPANKFRGLDPVTARQRRLYTFSSPADVEVVARAMRHFDSDGIILEEAAQLGEIIIKCGMNAFPGDVGLIILTANYLMEVKRDGPAARTQLQLALKGGPSLIQRYQIFSTIENSKRLKDGQEGQLDLQSYVEFKRNYRAVIRMHKSALAAQRDVWTLMQHNAVRASTVQAAMTALDVSADAAQRVYRRVLERYPNNGKLLRCYGKFLEDVRNEPEAANRVYAEAARNGGADGLLSLDLKIQGSDKPEFLTSMDLHEDACIVINAEGKVLMVNSCVGDLLGYPRAELEGSNVAMIMPQPFSSRHPGYISRYVQEGEPHILDTVRDVVALHKERYVFPVRLCVTKLSGVGTDAVFLGLLRPASLDARSVRAWVTPNGIILCTDPQFASLTGMLGEEMVGRNFRTLCTDIAAVDALLDLCRTTPYEKLSSDEISLNIGMAHRYLPSFPVRLTVRPGGTDGQRILILNAQRLYTGEGSADSAPPFSMAPGSSLSSSYSEGLMVVDQRGALVFATWDVAAMLGYPLRSFLRMKLEQLLPEPFATLHAAKYLREAPLTIPPVSCRAGRLVNLVNSNGTHVPVRLKISTKDDDGTTGRGGGRSRHVIQVSKVDAANAGSLYSDKRLVYLCTMDGKVLSVDQPTSNLFGFTASACVGSNLADCIDVFSEWRTKAGAHQMELLLLSLLDKEAEMPGTSWRVKVHSPEGEEGLMLPSGTDAKGQVRRLIGRSACLQTELVEALEDVATAAATVAVGVNGEAGGNAGGGGGSSECGGGGGGGGDGARLPRQSSSTVSRVETTAAAGTGTGAIKIMARVILWRRDVLTGVVELDDELVVRKADVGTGLIVGLPPSSLLRTPLNRLLDINKGMTWEDLMLSDSRKQKPSALKGSTMAIVSEPRAFIGPHPDGGTMRIIVQGVSGVGGRILATFHPDTSYVGARANLYRALGLEAIMHHQQQVQHQQQALQRQQTQKLAPLPTTPLEKQLRPQQQQRQQQQQAPDMLQLRRPASRAVLPRDNSGTVATPEHDKSRGSNCGKDKMEDVRYSRAGGGADSAPRPAIVTTTAAAKTAAAFKRRVKGKAARKAANAADKDGGDEAAQDSAGGGLATAAADGGEVLESSETPSSVIVDGEEVRGGEGDGGGEVDGDDDNDGGGDDGDDVEDEDEEEEEDESSSNDDDGGDDDDKKEKDEKYDEEGTKLHKRAHTQSEFIASWVRSLSRQMTAARERHNSKAPSKEPSRKSLMIPSASAPAVTNAASRPLSRAEIGSRGGGGGGNNDEHTRALLVRASTKLLASGVRRSTSGVGATPSFRRRMEDPPADPLTEDPLDWDFRLHDSPMGRIGSSRLPRRENAYDFMDGDNGDGARTADAADGGAGEDGVLDGVGVGHLRGPDDGQDTGGLRSRDGLAHITTPNGGGGGGGGSSIDDDEEGSQGPGGGRGSLSDFTSATDVELTTDARRSRLLKRMAKVLIGPSMEVSLSRLMYRTLLLLAGMLITHVICYVVLVNLIDSQYGHVHGIHRVALASDRCQMVTLKACIMEFCSRAGVEPLYVCEMPVTAALKDLRASLDDLESYHQSVYLGTATASAGDAGAGQTPQKMTEAVLYDMWTNPEVTYQLYLDVAPTRWLNLTTGVWQLGNRFIATGRDLLYWGQKLAGKISDLRAFHFLKANGPWAVFQSYTVSLDHVARIAWQDVTKLQQSLLIILLIEAVAVQLSCIVYEWWLVRRVELRRRGTLLVPLGLPGPVLKMLSTRPLVVVEDSDDDDADSEDANAEGMAGDDGGDGAAQSDAYGTSAIRTPRQSASIYFAPLRVSASGDNGSDSGGAGGSGPGNRHHHHTLPPGPVRSTCHRNAHASIDFAPLRETTEVQSGGHTAGTRLPGRHEAAAAAPLEPQELLPPTVELHSRPAGLVDAEVLPLEPTPMLQDHQDDVESERAAPVRHGVMMLGAGTGSVNAAATDSINIGGRRTAVVVVCEGRGSRLVINGKLLLANARDIMRFLVPLMLWEVALATVGGLSYFWLQNMQGPLASLNMASHVIYRYTRVRMLALLLVAGSDPSERSHWRNALKAELTNLRDEYDTMLYGGVASTQEGSVFQHAVPASTFESSSFAGNFFKEERCFRWDQSKCYTPDSPYYEVTHHGLDTMMRRVMSELELMAADEDADVAYTSTRYITMYMVGTRDLYEGLQSSAQLFVDYMIGRYQNVKLLHSLLLVATIILFLLYALLVLRPYLAMVAREAQRLAGLLSHVPAEIDIVSHTRQVMKSTELATGADMGVNGSGVRRRRGSTTGVASAPTGAAVSATGSGGVDSGGAANAHHGRDQKRGGGKGGAVKAVRVSGV